MTSSPQCANQDHIGIHRDSNFFGNQFVLVCLIVSEEEHHSFSSVQVDVVVANSVEGVGPLYLLFGGVVWVDAYALA